MLSCVLALRRSEGPTWSARETSGGDAEFSGELVNNGEGDRLLHVVRHTRTELILHDDLVDEYPQCAPVVPNICNPKARIDVALPIETGADKSFGSVDCSIPPIQGHACSPGLEVAVDFKRYLTDDPWICDLTILKGCSKVDYSERNLRNGTWAGNIAVSPLLPDGAGFEIVSRLHQDRRDGNMLQHAGQKLRYV
jgi:hypothetical protein